MIVVLCENTKCLLTFEVKEDFSVEHKQTLSSEHKLIDFVIVKNTIYAAIDTESDDELLELFKFNDSSILEHTSSDIIKKISVASDCEVESRADFYPLYYISSLRKRSEH